MIDDVDGMIIRSVREQPVYDNCSEMEGTISLLSLNIAYSIRFFFHLECVRTIPMSCTQYQVKQAMIELDERNEKKNVKFKMIA